MDLLERHHLRRNEPTLEELRAEAEAKKLANKRPEAGPLALRSLLQTHDKLQLERSGQKVDELEKQLKEEEEILESIKNAASKGLMSAEELAKGIKYVPGPAAQ